VYFRTATLTQERMKSLAADFRRWVQSELLACWNLSDYALLCWLSVGGETADLVRLWQEPEQALNEDERLVVDVLKEKTGVDVATHAASFVDATGRVAARARPQAVAG